MGRRKCLNDEQKSKIVQQLKQGKTIKQIFANMKRYPNIQLHDLLKIKKAVGKGRG